MTDPENRIVDFTAPSTPAGVPETMGEAPETMDDVAAAVGQEHETRRPRLPV